MSMGKVLEVDDDEEEEDESLVNSEGGGDVGGGGGGPTSPGVELMCVDIDCGRDSV